MLDRAHLTQLHLKKVFSICLLDDLGHRCVFLHVVLLIQLQFIYFICVAVSATVCGPWQHCLIDIIRGSLAWPGFHLDLKINCTVSIVSADVIETTV